MKDKYIVTYETEEVNHYHYVLFNTLEDAQEWVNKPYETKDKSIIYTRIYKAKQIKQL